MPTPRKYQKGARFTDLNDLAAWMAKDGYFWFAGKPVHPAWISSWHFRMVWNHMATGQLCKAERIGAAPAMLPVTEALRIDEESAP